MEVYGGWQEQDRGLDSYRSATKRVAHTHVTNHANISEAVFIMPIWSEILTELEKHSQGC